MSRQRHPYIPPVMKTSSVSLVILTATLFAVPARAQQEMPAADTPDKLAGPMKKNYQELIKRHDKNGDGRLDEEEKAAAHAAMRKEGGGGQGDRRKQLLKRFDKNGDGRLDDTERAAAEKFRAKQLKKFDQDGDGQLSDAEREVALRALMADPPAGRKKKDR